MLLAIRLRDAPAASGTLARPFGTPTRETLMTSFRWLCLAITAAVVHAPLAAQAPRRAADAARQARDSAAIRAEIVRGAEAFMRGDPDTILDHYAKDVVLAYPGIPDMDYATLAKGYAELRTRPAGVTAKTEPTFDELLVSGDMAVVRLRWTTTITVAEPASTNTRHMRDLQVWRREPSGRWMFIRGMHFREPPAPTGGRAP